MLFNRDGSLLATVGEDATAEKTNAASVSAIMANIWASFAKAGDAHVVLLDCENGRAGVTVVAGTLLLCLYGDASTPFGMLKLKAETLAKYLDAPLSQILGSGGGKDNK
eukprot:TRINITY_DN184_c0_g7_i3.p1 TRINITY_DN184_c0_g7~~TRINITY_DN184_c0_g7_i3.p1  ORF type:complete len:109 (-),score=23.77 TRINITY_DN184_c0_g7_i3:240-566(-)